MGTVGTVGTAGIAGERVRRVEVAGSLRWARERWSGHAVGSSSSLARSVPHLGFQAPGAWKQKKKTQEERSNQAAACVHGVLERTGTKLMPIHLIPSGMMTPGKRYPTPLCRDSSCAADARAHARGFMLFTRIAAMQAREGGD